MMNFFEFENIVYDFMRKCPGGGGNSIWNRLVGSAKELGTKVKIKVSSKVKEIHPVVKHIVINLAELDFIHFIRVTPEFLQASNEVTDGRIKNPVTKPDHPTAIGVSLIIDIPYKNMEFYETVS